MTNIKLFESKMVFSNVFIRNNIFDESTSLCLYSLEDNSGSNTDKMWAAFTMDYNCYYQPSGEKQIIRWRGGTAKGGDDYFMGDIKAYQAKSGKEYHSLFADPKLTPKYTLQPGSPAIEAGIDIGYPYSGAAPDMGSF